MRRWMPWAGGGTAVLVLLGVGLFAFRGEESSGDADAGRYTERELMMPGATFRFPDVERELLTPRIRSIVDPEQPLSREQLERLRMDSLEALYHDLNPRMEHAVEDLLFEE